MQTDRRDRMLLAALLLIFVVVAALWSLGLPAFETPDEPGHARYVNFLIENARLPRAGDEAPGEAHQPPLYYALAATVATVGSLGPIDVTLERNPAFRWYGGASESKYLHAPGEQPPLSGSARALHWLRLLSVCLGAGTVAMVHRLASAAAPPPRALLAAGLVAFLPQFTFVSASLNNDNLANLVAAATLACLALAVAAPGRPRLSPWVAAGALAGVGLLVKFTGLVMLACGLIAIALTRRQARPSSARKTLAFLVPALIVPAPLLLRNLMVLGDPLGAAAQMETLPQLLDRKTILSTYFVAEFPSVLFRSFWGTFGWMSFPLSGVFYAVCLLLTLAGLLGLALGRRDETTRRLHRLFAAAIALQLAQIVVYNLTFTQAQGRFLFPVIGPIAILLATGLTDLAARAGLRVSYAAVCAVLATLCLVDLYLLRFVVLPAYGAGG